MDRLFIRSTAFSFAFACGAMVVGPGVVGIAQSNAILGIGPDLFDLFQDNDKSAMNHPRPGSEEFSARAARTVGIETNGTTTGRVPPPLPAAPPVRSPAPEAVPVPATIEPGPGSQIAPADSYPPPTKIPDSFRVGYGEYLRAATTTDLFAAALPGVVGIAGFTLLGMYAGYHQARAVQAALVPAVPTQFLM
jgi:hypothetical protein